MIGGAPRGFPRAAPARHLVGADAQAIAFWDRLIPTQVIDRVTRISLGL
jgi:hypothetical protein